MQKIWIKIKKIEEKTLGVQTGLSPVLVWLDSDVAAWSVSMILFGISKKDQKEAFKQ